MAERSTWFQGRRIVVLVSRGHISPFLRLTCLRSHAAVELGKKLFPLFALALNLPEDFFDDKVRDSCMADPSPSSWKARLETQRP